MTKKTRMEQDKCKYNGEDTVRDVEIVGRGKREEFGLEG